MQKLTIALGLWAAIGPLVGILVGHFLSRSWQEKQWHMDRRKEEWRELLTALAESVKYETKIYEGVVLSGADERAIVDAHASTFRVIRDRIFLAADVVTLNIENRWSKACKDHYATLDAVAFGKTYDTMRLEIVKAATAGR